MGWCNHQQTGCEQVCLCAEAINTFLLIRNTLFYNFSIYDTEPGIMV